MNWPNVFLATLGVCSLVLWLVSIVAFFAGEKIDAIYFIGMAIFLWPPIWSTK
jgi:hypothetical protein